MQQFEIFLSFCSVTQQLEIFFKLFVLVMQQLETFLFVLVMQQLETFLFVLVMQQLEKQFITNGLAIRKLLTFIV